MLVGSEAGLLHQLLRALDALWLRHGLESERHSAGIIGDPGRHKPISGNVADLDDLARERFTIDGKVESFAHTHVVERLSGLVHDEIFGGEYRRVAPRFGHG